MSRLKPGSHRTLVFPEYGITNASNCKCDITTDSNPKRGNKHTFIVVKPPRLNPMLYRILGSLKCGMTNSINYMCVFAQKGYHNIDLYYIHKSAHNRKRRPQDITDNTCLNDNKCNTPNAIRWPRMVILIKYVVDIKEY